MKPEIIPGRYLRNNHLAQCLHRRSTQVECRLIEVRVHLLQSWHHTQDDVGQTEGDVREYHRGIALRNAQRDEEQEERNTDDDVAVQYRNVVDKLDGVSCIPVPQIVDSDGGEGSEERGYGCGNQGDGYRIDECRRERMVGTFYKEILVELQREARPVAHHPGLGKREDDDDEDRGVEQQQEQPQITLTEYFLHHILGK